MKYGRLVYPPNPRIVSGTPYVNIGDVFQTLAWDIVFQACGVSPQETINVSRHMLREYAGEDVLLPMNGWFGTGRGSEIFPLSAHIRPLFVGYHNIRKRDAQALTGQTPVGCRDEATYARILPYAPNAYISGCMTLLFPTRTTAPTDGRVFVVDVSEKVRRAIPHTLLRDAQTFSHEVRYDPQRDAAQENARIEEVARGMIQKYADEAALVITSRLHCAMMCIALGVPVVLLRESFDERYAFVDRFTPLYDASEFDRICWSPQAPDVAEVKAQTMALACAALRGALTAEQTQAMHSYYMQRTRHRISTPFMVKAYDCVRDVSPALADFIREKMLFRFTIASGRNTET